MNNAVLGSSLSEDGRKSWPGTSVPTSLPPASLVSDVIQAVSLFCTGEGEGNGESQTLLNENGLLS